MKKAEHIRKATVKDMKKKLREKHKCLLIRCTGFGKTWILAGITKEYKKVLYFYPADVVKNTAEERIIKEMKSNDNVDFMSYMKLIRTNPMELDGYDLYIFDEAHRLGGEKTKEAVKQLMGLFPEKYFLGATATAERSDGYDIVSDLFDDSCTFHYSLHNAFQDNLIKRPYYYYCTYDSENKVAADLKEAALLAGQDPTDIKVKEVLKRSVFEIRKIYNLPTIIKSVCEDHIPDTSCMKFLVFFSSIKHLHNHMDEFIGWVKTAFPNHVIETMIISSESKELSENVERLQDQGYRKNTIYINCVIDMVNMGYHIDDLTAIFMMRCTNSTTIFSQQLGRVISSGAQNPGIVFDVVDNIHRKATFDLSGLKQEELREKKTSLEERYLELSEYIETVSPEEAQFVKDEMEKIRETLKKREEKKSFDKESDYWETKLRYAEETGEGDLSYYEDKMIEALNRESEGIDISELNRLYADDLQATKTEATYRELIAKVVAEPYMQRCREALIAHLNRWYRAKDKGFYLVDQEMAKDLSELSGPDFIRRVTNLLVENQLDYPIDNEKELLRIGMKNDGIPLKVFARWKNVSVKAILDSTIHAA